MIVSWNVADLGGNATRMGGGVPWKAYRILVGKTLTWLRWKGRDNIKMHLKTISYVDKKFGELLASAVLNV
jgi:hypothetical protein